MAGHFRAAVVTSAQAGYTIVILCMDCPRITSVAAGNLDAARKARGAYFTPPTIARFMADWAVRSATDRILEPSCGEASFLLAAGHRLRELGGLVLGDQLCGVELHRESAVIADRLLKEAGLCGTVVVDDYFTSDLSGSFDVVIGNPPYVRYQDFSGAARRRSQEAALEVGVNLSGLSSSWAAFVVQAAQHLKSGGRMALVLPAELLTVNYAATIRRFLLNRFSTVKLISFEQLVFPDALEEVVLLLAEGSGPTDRLELYQASDAKDLPKSAATWTSVSAEGDSKWTAGLLPDEVESTYLQALQLTKFVSLSDWGRPYLGAVTGNNRWFALSNAEADDLGLAQADLVRLSPPGSRHLRGLTFTDKSWEHLRREGKKVWLFYPESTQNEAVVSRILDGERTGVANAYKCRVREPWWKVPLVRTPDLFLTYMNHAAPQLVANRAKVEILNSVHGVELHPGLKQVGMDLLPMAMLNSITLLGAELVGRSYGGGMLKLEPREADSLPLPSPDHLSVCAADLRALRPQLGRHLRSGDLMKAAEAVDRVLFRGDEHLDRHQKRLLRTGRSHLFERRRARGGRSRATT